MTKSEQARADAMADAETLREIVEAWDEWSAEKLSTRLRGAAKQRAHQTKRERFLAAVAAARAAFERP